MTASPGSEAERIAEICANLGIESIETKSESDPDVAPFVHHREIEWIKVEVPEQLQKIRGVIDGLVSERMEEINSLGMCRIDPKTSKGNSWTCRSGSAARLHVDRIRTSSGESLCSQRS